MVDEAPAVGAADSVKNNHSSASNGVELRGAAVASKRPWWRRLGRFGGDGGSSSSSSNGSVDGEGGEGLREILSSVSGVAQKGELVGVLGPSGAASSTRNCLGFLACAVGWLVGGGWVGAYAWWVGGCEKGACVHGALARLGCQIRTAIQRGDGLGHYVLLYALPADSRCAACLMQHRQRVLQHTCRCFLCRRNGPYCSL